MHVEYRMNQPKTFISSVKSKKKLQSKEVFEKGKIIVYNWNCHKSPVARASFRPYCNVQIQRTFSYSRMVPNKQDPELSVVYSYRKYEIAKNFKSDELFPPIQDRAGTAFFKS